MPAYAARTPPLMVAMPTVMTAINSDSVMLRMNGFTTSGDSMSPTKIFDAAQRVSAPDVRRVRCMIHASSCTILCITPRW